METRGPEKLAAQVYRQKETRVGFSHFLTVMLLISQNKSIDLGDYLGLAL